MLAWLPFYIQEVKAFCTEMKMGFYPDSFLKRALLLGILPVNGQRCQPIYFLVSYRSLSTEKFICNRYNDIWTSLYPFTPVQGWNTDQNFEVTERTLKFVSGVCP